MYYSLFYDARLSICFYLWNTAHILFSILALYAALVPFIIPNISLVSYGLSIVCLWQTIPKMFEKRIFLIAQKSEKRAKYSLSLAFHAFFLLYTTILSAASNFFLFPHPVLHIVLSVCIYFIGFMLSLFLFSISYGLWKGELSDSLQHSQEKQNVRKVQIEKWIQIAKEKKESFPKENFNFLEKSDCFKVKTLDYIVNRMFSIILWLMIPIWIFVIIPLRSFSSWEEIPFVYLACMIGTFVWGIFWVGSFLLKSAGKYYTTEHGMLLQNLCFSKIFFWHEVKSVQIEEDFVKIHKFQGKALHILLQDLENAEKFFLKLQNFLPLSIFFIESSGWKSLKKIMKDEFSDFEEKYQKICDGISNVLDERKKNKQKFSKSTSN